MSDLKVIDLFSGIGGFALGLEWAGGFETIRFCETDDFCCKVLEKNFPGVPITRDIHDFKARHREAEVVVGGFPCQPFSHAGRREPESDARNLWPEMRRVIDECSPDWVVCENVTGLVSMGLDRVLFDLADSGYHSQTLAIPAHAVGAPHRRERIWIIAARMSVSYPGSDAVRLQWQRYREQRDEQRQAESRDERLVADSGGERLAETRPVSEQQEGGRHSSERSRDHPGSWRSGRRLGALADADSARLERRSEYRECSCQSSPWACCRAHEGARLARSGIRRVSHGIPTGMDFRAKRRFVRERRNRLKALGNAVVPQIVEEIGRAIREATQDE